MKTMVHVSSDTDYYRFVKIIRDIVQSNFDKPIFRTNAEGLFEAYLEGIDTDRQHYNCKCCKKFLEDFGGLVVMVSDTEARPMFWGKGDWPAFFAKSAALMHDRVIRSKITGVFYNGDEVWGRPKTGEWTHLSGVPNKVVGTKLKTAFQMEAEKNTDFAVLKHSLSDFSLEVAEQALRVLDADVLDRSEKTLGVCKWFVELHKRLKDIKGTKRDNMIWLAVATAPVGWTHVRSSMIGTLLDDIKQGMDFDTISARWAKKMHPLQYMRPTAPPSDGQIAQANKIIGTLQTEGALNRRFAQLEEITAFWKPSADPAKEPQKANTGVFDFLKSKKTEVAKIQLPDQLMTWTRFKDEVLPGAWKLEFYTQMHGPYFGMVTADLTAPPLLQWDTEPRNPFSWFFFHGGSYATKWNLNSGQWVEINALCHKPPHWHHPELFAKEGEAVFMVLNGARLTASKPGGMFFPESLRAEYHEIRKVMEAFANKTCIAKHEEGTANGFALQKGNTFNAKIRVNGLDTYKLDRWH